MNAIMQWRREQSYYVGFCDTTISEVSRWRPDFFEGCFLVITCLDSMPRVSSLTEWIAYIRSKGWEIEFVGQAVCVRPEYAVQVACDARTFHGFDEVYLLPHRPSRDLYDVQIYTSDGYRFADGLPPDFVSRMEGLGAARYLSDGCGMNFACDSMDWVRALAAVEHIAGGPGSS